MKRRYEEEGRVCDKDVMIVRMECNSELGVCVYVMRIPCFAGHVCVHACVHVWITWKFSLEYGLT